MAVLTYKGNYPIPMQCKECENFAGFTIKGRQRFPDVKHYLSVFNACAVFLDWKNGAD